VTCWRAARPGCTPPPGVASVSATTIQPSSSRAHCAGSFEGRTMPPERRTKCRSPWQKGHTIVESNREHHFSYSHGCIVSRSDRDLATLINTETSHFTRSVATNKKRSVLHAKQQKKKLDVGDHGLRNHKNKVFDVSKSIVTHSVLWRSSVQILDGPKAAKP
jgi:hypothetical protein